jgi:hypothetical protein
MSHDEMATRYRNEADRLLAEIGKLSNADAQAALLQMARQYQKLAAHHDALAYFSGGIPGEPKPA